MTRFFWLLAALLFLVVVAVPALCDDDDSDKQQPNGKTSGGEQQQQQGGGGGGSVEGVVTSEVQLDDVHADFDDVLEMPIKGVDSVPDLNEEDPAETAQDAAHKCVAVSKLPAEAGPMSEAGVAHYVVKEGFRAAPRAKTTVGAYLGAETYFAELARVFREAKTEIVISGWKLNLDMLLERDAEEAMAMHGMWTAHGKAKASKKTTAAFQGQHGDAFASRSLGGLLKAAIARGVAVHVLLYKQVWMQDDTNAKSAKILKKMGAQVTLRRPRGDIRIMYSMHEKYVIVDQEVAYVGGLDIAAGRWDSRFHKPLDPRRIDVWADGSVHMPDFPWQDVQLGLGAGKAVEDLRTRFFEHAGKQKHADAVKVGETEQQQQQMSIGEKQEKQREGELSLSDDKKEQGEQQDDNQPGAAKTKGGEQVEGQPKEGGDDQQPVKTNPKKNKVGEQQQQQLLPSNIPKVNDKQKDEQQQQQQGQASSSSSSSTSSGLVPQFGDEEGVSAHDDATALLVASGVHYPHPVKAPAGLQSSILRAWLGMIANAKTYVLLENQYLLTRMLCDADGSPESSTRTEWPLHNTIGHELLNAVERAISDDRPFHVYVILPMLPDVEQYVSPTFCSVGSEVGQNSLFAVFKKRFPGEEFSSFFTVVAPRSFDVVTSAEEDAGKVAALSAYFPDASTAPKLPAAVSQMVYVHTKVLVVDDEVAFVGSANVNDRSLRGTRDSEVGYVVGSPPFARELRTRLLRQLDPELSDAQLDDPAGLCAQRLQAAMNDNYAVHRAVFPAFSHDGLRMSDFGRLLGMAAEGGLTDEQIAQAATFSGTAFPFPLEGFKADKTALEQACSRFVKAKKLIFTL